MPALAVIDGSTLLLILGIEQGGALGAYSAYEIDQREASMGSIGDIAEEFAYCDTVLTDAGYDTASLTDLQYSLAVRALAYGCAYRLIQLDRSSQIVQPSTKEGMGIIAALDTSAAHFYARADHYYTQLGVTSKYTDVTPKSYFSSVTH